MHACVRLQIVVPLTSVTFFDVSISLCLSSHLQFVVVEQNEELQVCGYFYCLYLYKTLLKGGGGGVVACSKRQVDITQLTHQYWCMQ